MPGGEVTYAAWTGSAVSRGSDVTTAMAVGAMVTSTAGAGIVSPGARVAPTRARVSSRACFSRALGTTQREMMLTTAQMSTTPSAPIRATFHMSIPKRVFFAAEAFLPARRCLSCPLLPGSRLLLPCGYSFLPARLGLPRASLPGSRLLLPCGYSFLPVRLGLSGPPLPGSRLLLPC